MTEATILGFNGSWGSGLASLFLQKDDGSVELVHADNGPLVRALEACFGGVITAGHCVDNKAIEGKRIRYSVDDLGLLEGFDPVDD